MTVLTKDFQSINQRTKQKRVVSLGEFEEEFKEILIDLRKNIETYFQTK